MKIYQKISFRILFSLTILFCFGLYSYSNYDRQNCIPELSAGTNSVESSLIPDIDSLNDDQINHTDKFSSIVERENHIPVANDCFLILKFCISVWQPPKLS
jgi:hypothetical protein